MIFTHYTEQYLEHSLWNCSQVNATEPYWWEAYIGSDNGLVSSDNKPLPELMLTSDGITRPQWVKHSQHINANIWPVYNALFWRSIQLYFHFISYLSIETVKAVKISSYRSQEFAYTVRSRYKYNAVNLLRNIYKRHPHSSPVRGAMGCLLWIQHLINILPQFL